jgi:hypothetical protein
MALPSNLTVASTIYDFDYAQRVTTGVAFPLCRALYFDTAELVCILLLGNGDTATIWNVRRGTLLPIRCTRVTITSGTMIALY